MNENVVEVKQLSVCYGKTQALKDITINVEKGEYLGIIGPNGGGKSTLLKALLGLMPFNSGSVKVFGVDPGKCGKQVGYVPQFSHFDKKFPINLNEVVLTGRQRSGLSPFFKYSKEDKQIVDNLLEKVGIADLKDRQISMLSGGEFQKMLIARALAVEPKLLILDEPTASVDASSREQIYDLLAQLNKNITIILVTHDLFAISSKVQRLACLNRDLVYHGEPELNQKIVNKLYGCPVDIIAHGVPHRVLKDHREE